MDRILLNQWEDCPGDAARRKQHGIIDTMTKVNKKYFTAGRFRNSFFHPATGMHARMRQTDPGATFKWLSLLLVSFILVVSSVHADKNPSVRVIFVNSQSEAEEILAEIGKGALFATLARERSVDKKSRDRYGEIAFQGLAEPLKDAALRLKEGEVSGVIQLGDNRHALVLAVDMTYYRKGASAFRSKDFKTAGTNILRHIELNPDAVKARVMLGQIQEAAKELSKAEASYRNAIRFDPLHEEAYERLGELYLRQGQFGQAKDLYEEGLNSIPGSKALKTGLGKLKRQLAQAENSPSKSEAPGDKTSEGGPAKKNALPGTAISKGPQDQKIYLRIIVTASEADAENILSELKKGTPFALLAKARSIDENTRQAYGYIGEVAVDSLDANLRKAALELDEGQTSGVIRVGQDRYALIHATNMRLYSEGEKAFIAGDFKTAGEKLRQYAEDNPDSIKTSILIGKIHEDKKELSKAVEVYKKAILFNPGTVLLYDRLARVYLILGEYQRAKDVYTEGLRQVPASPVLEEGVGTADMLLIGKGQRLP